MAESAKKKKIPTLKTHKVTEAKEKSTRKNIHSLVMKLHVWIIYLVL